MSRLGKKPISIPKGVKVFIEGNTIKAEGPKGKISKTIHSRMKFKVLGDSAPDVSKGVSVTVPENSQFVIERPSDDKLDKSLHGLSRKLVTNMIEGVVKGFEKQLEVSGLGYRATVIKEGFNIEKVYTHPVLVPFPEEIKVEIKEGKVIVRGVDKELVGRIASDIRRIKPVEPYKGKGIKYVGEHVRRKAGKSVVKTAGA